MIGIAATEARGRSDESVMEAAGVESGAKTARGCARLSAATEPPARTNEAEWSEDAAGASAPATTPCSGGGGSRNLPGRQRNRALAAHQRAWRPGRSDLVLRDLVVSGRAWAERSNAGSCWSDTMWRERGRPALSPQDLAAAWRPELDRRREELVDPRLEPDVEARDPVLRLVEHQLGLLAVIWRARAERGQREPASDSTRRSAAQLCPRRRGAGFLGERPAFAREPRPRYAVVHERPRPRGTRTGQAPHG
jgi:hypothetical protein